MHASSGGAGDQTSFLRLLVLYGAALRWNGARAPVGRGGALAAVAAAVLLFAMLEAV